MKDFEIQAPSFCSLHLTHCCVGKCLPTNPQRVKTKVAKNIICKVWWFPLCQYFHYGQFQLTNIFGVWKKCSQLTLTRPQFLFSFPTLGISMVCVLGVGRWGGGQVKTFSCPRLAHCRVGFSQASLGISRAPDGYRLSCRLLELKNEQWHVETEYKLMRYLGSINRKWDGSDANSNAMQLLVGVPTLTQRTGRLSKELPLLMNWPTTMLMSCSWPAWKPPSQVALPLISKAAHI